MRANQFNSLRLTFLYQTGEGGILSKILHGYRLCPEVQPLLIFLYLPFLTEK